MPQRSNNNNHVVSALEKSATGIGGLDEITGGGLPKGRTTIVCGGPGCGKTMMGIEFLVRGATEFGEPGVLMAFEETPQEMAKNVASLGFDLKGLAERKKLFLEHVYIEPSDIEEAGDYDLEGLFVRLQNAVETVGAKRVLLDTVEALFSGFRNAGILRAEIRRLFRWLKDRGLTTVVTAERGEGTLTRHGLEEYVSDCVILLDHRINEQISTRRLRVVKYRGTSHGSDEYPFLIDREGMSVLPVTSIDLQHAASSERVSSGIGDLDDMLEGQGYFRGSSVLITGTAGTGKTTLATSFAEASCGRGEKCLYVAFEESLSQLTRNMHSVGCELGPAVKKGLLIHRAWRPSQYGMEMHLLRIHKLVEEFEPRAVVLDPITNLINSSTDHDVHGMLVRLMDFLKMRKITALFTSLTTAGTALEHSDVAISSLIDTWIALRDIELNGERNRAIYIIKSRGMAHSNQLREFVMGQTGIRLMPAYLGPGGVLTGSSRLAQQAQEKAREFVRQQEIESQRVELDRQRQALQAQIVALQAEFASKERQMQRLIDQAQWREEALLKDEQAMSKSRGLGSGNGRKTRAVGGGR